MVPLMTLRRWAALRELKGKCKTFIELYSFFVILYHFIYASGLLSWLGITIGGIHPAISVGLILSILYLLFPYSKKTQQTGIPWYDWILAILCLIPTGYYALNYEMLLYSALTPTDFEVVLGVVMIILCIEGVRRAIGLPLVICGLIFVIYPLVANSLPGILFAAPVKFRRLIGYIYLGSQGFFSAGAQVFSTTIITFVIFGQLIAISDGGVFFLNLSLSAMGGRNGFHHGRLYGRAVLADCFCRNYSSRAVLCSGILAGVLLFIAASPGRSEHRGNTRD